MSVCNKSFRGVNSVTITIAAIAGLLAPVRAEPPVCGAVQPDGRQDVTIVYSNTANPAPYGLSYTQGAWIGDDIYAVGLGKLETLRFSVWHTPDAAGHADPLLSCRADVAFCRYYYYGPGSWFGTFSRDLAFGDGLAAGDYALFYLTGLSTEDIDLKRQSYIFEMRLYDKYPPTSGDLGQIICGPPTIGSSYGDKIWLDGTVADPPGSDKGWYWLGSDPKLSFYWEIGVFAYGPGDLNCDGVLNAFDIDPFTLALTEPAGYPFEYPDCDVMLADINGDGKVDGFDIDPFIELLLGG